MHKRSLASWKLVLLGLASCSSRLPPPPSRPAPLGLPVVEPRTDAVRLEMRGAPLTSLAYRSQSEQSLPSEVFVDFGTDGSPRIVRRTRDRTSSEADRLALVSAFPLPEQPLGGARISESFPIPGTVEADGVIVQTFERTSITSTEVRVRWVRQVRAPRPTFFALPDTMEETNVQCDATYDRQAGRYSEVRCGDGTDEERSVTTLRFDPELSRQRTATLAAIHRREEAGARGLDAWEAAHPRERELRKALALLPGNEGMMATVFYLRAAPEEVMRAALELPSGKLGAFFGVAALWLDAAELSDDTVALVRQRLARDPDLARAFCRRHDERFRPELTRLAASRDEYVADTARRTLAGLDVVRRGPSRLRDVRDPGVLSGLGPTLLRDGRLSEWIPALIDVLAAHEGEEAEEEEEEEEGEEEEEDGAEAWRRAVTTLLAQVGLPNLGASAVPWRAWWARHRDGGPVEWAVEDLSSPVIASRILGAARLSNTDPGEEGRELLARALRDPETSVRITAARSLAQLGDRRAASILVEDMIRGDGELKLSFATLAHLHGTTLGFDPLAPEMDRAEAAGRWREWARRISAASR